MAARLGTDHHELVVEPASFMDHWETAVLRRGAPVSEASDIPIFMLSKLASSSVKMVLTGEGSDELMGGYPKHRVEPWVELYQRLTPSVLHERLIRPLVRALPYSMRRVKVVALAAGERDPINRMRLWFGGVSLKDQQWDTSRSACSWCVDSTAQSFFDQTSWRRTTSGAWNRMMMAGSIEGRMPSWMWCLVVARFPDRFLIGTRGGKAVLRTSMKKRLPPAILHRKKVGFRVPFGTWLRGPYREFARDMLDSDASRLAQICNRAKLGSLFREHVEGRQNHERILWALINLEIFLRV